MRRPLIALLAVILAGCAQDSAYRVARLLFDGVPAPAGSAEPGAAAVAERGPQSGAGSANGAADAGETPLPDGPEAARVRRLSIHAPYASGACGSCHDPHNSNQLRSEGNELCASCHTEILTGKPVAHLPAAADCLICHQPHQSSEPRLLLQPVQSLCLDCHVRETIQEVHGEVADCRTCHNPHESDLARLLEVR